MSQQFTLESARLSALRELEVKVNGNTDYDVNIDFQIMQAAKQLREHLSSLPEPLSKRVGLNTVMGIDDEKILQTGVALAWARDDDLENGGDAEPFGIAAHLASHPTRHFVQAAQALSEVDGNVGPVSARDIRSSASSLKEEYSGDRALPWATVTGIAAAAAMARHGSVANFRP